MPDVIAALAQNGLYVLEAVWDVRKTGGAVEYLISYVGYSTRCWKPEAEVFFEGLPKSFKKAQIALLKQEPKPRRLQLHEMQKKEGFSLEKGLLSFLKHKQWPQEDIDAVEREIEDEKIGMGMGMEEARARSDAYQRARAAAAAAEENRRAAEAARAVNLRRSTRKRGAVTQKGDEEKEKDKKAKPAEEVVDEEERVEDSMKIDGREEVVDADHENNGNVNLILDDEMIAPRDDGFEHIDEVPLANNGQFEGEEEQPAGLPLFEEDNMGDYEDIPHAENGADQERVNYLEAQLQLYKAQLDALFKEYVNKLVTIDQLNASVAQLKLAVTSKDLWMHYYQQWALYYQQTATRFANELRDYENARQLALAVIHAAPVEVVDDLFYECNEPLIEEAE